MPRGTWTAKDERKYEAILESCQYGKRRRSKKTCQRIAAATVNRDRGLRGFEVRERETGGRDYFAFEARQDGEEARPLRGASEGEVTRPRRRRRVVDVPGLGKLAYDPKQPCGLPFEKFRTHLRFADGYEWIAWRKNEHGEDLPGRPSAKAIVRQLSRAKAWLYEEYLGACEPFRVAEASRPGCGPVCHPERSKPCGDACVPLEARCKTPPGGACSFEDAYGAFEAPPPRDEDDDGWTAEDFRDEEPFTLFGLGKTSKSSCPHAKRFGELVNMTPAEIRAWAKDPRSKLASWASTRARLPALATLKAKPVAQWTEADCKFAARVVSFNSRMDGMRKEHGCTTKIDVSLRNWGRRAPGCKLPKKP